MTAGRLNRPKFLVRPIYLKSQSRQGQYIGIVVYKTTVLTFSEAVAIRVPCPFSVIQLSGPSCAAISTGDFSVFAKSTICTCPALRPGNAKSELLLFGHMTHKPGKERNLKLLEGLYKHVGPVNRINTHQLGRNMGKIKMGFSHKNSMYQRVIFDLHFKFVVKNVF